MEEQQLKLVSTIKLLKKQKMTRAFIKGPIELSWILKACELSKSAMKSALAILFLGGIHGNTWFKFESSAAKRFNLNRQSKSAGLQELKRAGLIEIEQKQGALPLIKISETSKQSKCGPTME